jgi:hypothetical protein
MNPDRSALWFNHDDTKAARRIPVRLTVRSHSMDPLFVPFVVRK